MGEGYGTYRAKPSAFFASFGLNIVVTALLVLSGHWVVQHREQIRQIERGVPACVVLAVAIHARSRGPLAQEREQCF